MRCRDSVFLAGIVGLILVIGATFLMEPPVESISQDEGNSTDSFDVFNVAFISYDTSYEENNVLFEEIIEPEINNYTKNYGFDFTFDFTVIASNCGADTLEHIQGLKQTGTDMVIGSNCVACVAYSYMDYNEMILVSASKVQSSFSIEDDRMFEIYPPDQNTAPVVAAMIESWGITHPIMYQRGGQILDIVNERFMEEWKELGRMDPTIVTIEGDRSAFGLNYERLGNEIKTLVDSGVPYERICVITTMYELGDQLNQLSDYPETGKVVWFGTENTGSFSAPFNSSAAKQRGMFYPKAVVPESRMWNELKEKYAEFTGETADYVTATSYDAAWVIALTVMNTQSDDPVVLSEALRDVAFSHYGVTGWIHLDENGDRLPVSYEIYGYSEGDELTPYGSWDVSTYEVDWSDEAVAGIGLDRVAGS